MTDAEISRRLALAIGYKPENIKVPGVLVWGEQLVSTTICTGWYKFDYRDPAVIWPIAERFDCFPAQSGNKWVAVFKKDRHPVVRQAVFAETAAKAVALAVIKAHEGAKE